jgi:hypothetical protein
MRRTPGRFALALLCAACGNYPETPPTRLILESIPAAIFSDTGQTLRLSVKLSNNFGDVFTPDSVRWVSDDTTKVVISKAGVLRTLRSTPRVLVHVSAFGRDGAASVDLPVSISATGSALP